MTVNITTDFQESFSEIACKGDRHLRETARIYAYLLELDAELRDGRVSMAFWNVQDSASGWLKSKSTLRSGTPIWRLYPQHRYAIALLAKLGGQISALQICGHRELAAVELALSSDPAL